jgi:hypothetical protein
LVGGALASLAGKVQALFGKASAGQFRVRARSRCAAGRGAGPGLTNTAAAVFGRMVTVGWDGDVLGQ